LIARDRVIEKPILYTLETPIASVILSGAGAQATAQSKDPGDVGVFNADAGSSLDDLGLRGRIVVRAASLNIKSPVCLTSVERMIAIVHLNQVI